MPWNPGSYLCIEREFRRRENPAPLLAPCLHDDWLRIPSDRVRGCVWGADGAALGGFGYDLGCGQAWLALFDGMLKDAA